MNTVKIHIKKLLSIVLLSTVLFPLTIQFSHAFEKHEYSGTNIERNVHVHHPKNDCGVFHYQINFNTIEFSSTFLLNEIVLSDEKVITPEDKKKSTSIFNKSSRAPPLLIFLT